MTKPDPAEQFILNIRQTLNYDWNPIGVGDSPELQDEYDSYIDGLLDILDDEHASVDALKDYLILIENEQMGLKPDSNKAQKVAEKLWQHFESFIA